MHAAKSGIIAEFETGYLQREIRVLATVAGGTDKGLRDATVEGYATGRLVKVTGVGDEKVITAPENVTTTSIGDATHIIAQSDDTIREGEFAADIERGSCRPNLIVKNSDEKKTVALFKIINVDDIKLVNID